MLPRELVESALGSAPDAMVITDGSGSIVFANRQVTAVFGYDADEIIGRPIEHLLPARFRTQHITHRDSFVSAPRVRPMGVGLALAARRMDGTEFPVEISLSPIEEGEGALVAAAIRDVTDRKRIEDELVAAREAADHANQAKSRFLAAASHDLRQPLQTLSLLNGTLRRGSMDATSTEAVAQQEQAIGAMSRLVNGLLDISKLESGAIRPEITDVTVASIFKEMEQEFAGLAASKGLELEVEPCADTVRSDLSLLEQILRNLVSNAIKYTKRGKVLVRCLHETALVRLEVLDTGIGIPVDEVPYIFEEFYQVSVGPNTTRDGYGLGLSIVNRIVTLLGLKLTVQSEPGKGSTFALILPAGQPAAPAASRIGSEPTPSAKHAGVRVLLVEDDAAVRSATRMLLGCEGYQVTAVSTAAQALEQAEADSSIDLVVTDYHLGAGETGTQVISALRAALARPLKAVLITGDTTTAVMEFPGDSLLRFVSKPVQPDELLATIRALMDS